MSESYRNRVSGGKIRSNKDKDTEEWKMSHKLGMFDTNDKGAEYRTEQNRTRSQCKDNSYNGNKQRPRADV